MPRRLSSSRIMQAHRYLILFACSLGLPYVCFATNLWEHIILADCSTPSTVRISHMAYYSQTLTKEPQTVTVVPTGWNQTANWIRNESMPLSATFPDAITFSANLSVTHNQGDFAGYGTNGWGLMSCWRFEKAAIYSWYNVVSCSAVYDCNRQGAMGDPPNAPRPEDADDGETKRSNKIALGIGLGVGIPSLLVAIIGVWQAKKRGMLPSFHHAGESESGNESRNGTLSAYEKALNLLQLDQAQVERVEFCIQQLRILLEGRKNLID